MFFIIVKSEKSIFSLLILRVIDVFEIKVDRYRDRIILSERLIIYMFSDFLGFPILCYF